MRILIVGAGATGGYFGARLLAAGRDVTFLVRPQTAAQLAADGLNVESRGGDLHIPSPPTVVAAQLAGTFDLIILSPKARDLAQAMEDFAPAVGADTAILPLLNGMAHMGALDRRFTPANVIGGATNISAVRTPDGRIRHLNVLDRLYFGDRFEPDSERMRAIAAALTNAGFEAHLRPNIQQDLWDKWVSISTSAGITCLMRGAPADIMTAGGDPLARQLIVEGAAIARAEGFPPAADYLGDLAAFVTQRDSLFTASMLRDLESGGPIEAQQIVGDLLEYGHRHAVSTPLLEVVLVHLRTYENRRRRELQA